ncbi:MAG: hypothetical protein KF784_03390 [Fimbriimonadaceae bacterium]|nr:hypothetical protein [Fimbriimonadaceae bacterium]
MKKQRIVWEMVFVGVAVAVGIALSARTWDTYNQQRVKADKKVSEMKKAEQDREALLRQKGQYESPSGREQLAREQGYTKAGEKPLEGGR